MTRPRRQRARAADVSPERLDWLRGGAGGEDEQFCSIPEEFAALWHGYEEQIVGEHIAEQPGTRPLRWWEFSAPEPRRRVGGVGTPCHEHLAHVEHYVFGVPDQWISDIETYRRMGMPLTVPALDPDDAPLYESEASYLERLKLLAPGERRRLKPEDFEPESVIDILEMTADD
jgi:hypothetical protein